MREILLCVLQGVITVTVPVTVAYLCSFLKKKQEEANQRIENEAQKAESEAQKAAIDLKGKLLDEAFKNVLTAVKKTNQTYVDNLKKTGAFSFDNQESAFKKSMKTAAEIMRQEVKDFISAEYGDLNKWLDTQIEAAVGDVKDQKAKK